MSRQRRTVRWAAVCLLALLSACGDDAPREPVAEEQSATPTHFVVVVDRSTSVTASEAEAYRQVVSSVVDELSYGDRLTLLAAYSAGRRDGTVVVDQGMPATTGAATDASALEGAKASLGQSVQKVFETDSTALTDLLTSFRTAADHFQARTGTEEVLLILSDMLHCTRSDFCLDRQGWSGQADAWLDRAEATGMLPDLSGVCVSVMGAEVASPRDVSIRDFWGRYFEATGADFSVDRYVYSPVGSARRGCGE